MPIGAPFAHSATGTFCADGVQDVGVQSQSRVHTAVSANQVFYLGPTNNLAFRDLSSIEGIYEVTFLLSRFDVRMHESVFAFEEDMTRTEASSKAFV
jgi:hypothetical protein